MVWFSFDIEHSVYTVDERRHYHFCHRVKSRLLSVKFDIHSKFPFTTSDFIDSDESKYIL